MFNTKIPLYGIMILLSLMINIVVVILIYKKFNFSKDEIVGALIYENIGIITGAKILTFIQNYNEYDKFDLISLGLSSYGAVIGGLICLILFGMQFKKPIKNMLFAFMPSIPLMYSIGKIGCFLVGCCHGIEYHGIASVTYKFSQVAPNRVPLFPVQILETIVFALIFVYMFYKIFKNQFNWKTLGISFILCGFCKFILDYFRMSHINNIISLNQIISVVFIIVGIFIVTKNKVRLINIRK